MTAKERDMRRKIVEASIEVIEKEGIASLTVRAIAKRAGVNVAAVNYYFGSKEKLVDAALTLTLENAFADPLRELDSRSFSPDQLLRFILADWLQGMANYPGISRAHLIGHHLKRTQHTRSIHRLGNFLQELSARLQKLRPGIDPAVVRVALVQMVSATMMPALFPEVFASFLDADFTRPADREQYLNHLLRTYQQEFK